MTFRTAWRKSFLNYLLPLRTLCPQGKHGPKVPRVYSPHGALVKTRRVEYFRLLARPIVAHLPGSLIHTVSDENSACASAPLDVIVREYQAVKRSSSRGRARGPWRGGITHSSGTGALGPGGSQVQTQRTPARVSRGARRMER